MMILRVLSSSWWIQLLLAIAWYSKLTASMSKVFDQGDFSEDSTFQLTDWLAHVPKEVLAKNFKVNITAFDHIPSKELYIFPSGKEFLWLIRTFQYSKYFNSTTSTGCPTSDKSRRNSAHALHISLVWHSSYSPTRWFYQGLRYPNLPCCEHYRWCARYCRAWCDARAPRKLWSLVFLNTYLTLLN